MKRTAIAVALFSFVMAVPAFAAEGGQPPKGQEQTFEQKKASILKMLNARLANIQADKDCVEAAKNDDDLRACRDKGKARMEKEQAGRKRMDDRRKQGGQGQGGPGGQGQGGLDGQDRPAPPPPQGE